MAPASRTIDSGAAALQTRGKKGSAGGGSGGGGTPGSSPVLPSVAKSSTTDWSQITRVSSGVGEDALHRSRSKEEERKACRSGRRGLL